MNRLFGRASKYLAFGLASGPRQLTILGYLLLFDNLVSDLQILVSQDCIGGGPSSDQAEFPLASSLRSSVYKCFKWLMMLGSA